MTISRSSVGASRPRVAVAGGGACGLAMAWGAARAGARVAVYDQGPLGRGAFWASAGMIAPSFERHAPGAAAMDRALRRAIILWPDFANGLEQAAGLSVDLRLDGIIGAAAGADASCDVLSAAEARALEPALAISEGDEPFVFAAGEGQVDNRALAHAFLIALERAGAELRPGEAAARPLFDAAGELRALVLADGRREPCDLLFWTIGRGASDWMGTEAPPRARPVRGQALALANPALGPRRVIRGAEVYLAPKADGRVVVGATEERGRDDPEPDARVIGAMVAAAARFCPPLGEARMLESWSGVRPTLAGDRPIIGAWGDGGAHVALGAFRAGVALAPLLAAAGEAAATRTAMPESFNPFAPLKDESGAPARKAADMDAQGKVTAPSSWW